MSKFNSSEERLKALTSWTKEDERLSREYVGEEKLASMKPGYEGPKVKMKDSKKYFEFCSDRKHRLMYEEAIYFSRKYDAPEWHELTDEQRQKVINANDDYIEDINNLGDSLKP